jgi:hypothetical protein
VLVDVEIDEDAVAGEEASVPVTVVVGADIKVVGEEVSASVVMVVGADVEIVGEVILISMELEQSTPYPGPHGSVVVRLLGEIVV